MKSFLFLCVPQGHRLVFVPPAFVHFSVRSVVHVIAFLSHRLFAISANVHFFRCFAWRNSKSSTRTNAEQIALFTAILLQRGIHAVKSRLQRAELILEFCLLLSQRILVMTQLLHCLRNCFHHKNTKPRLFKK